MGHRQKHKGKKRPRSWHRRFDGPDRALRRALRSIDEALSRWDRDRTPGPEKPEA